mmetsp:Transcript_5262/g.8076  ORF Transcript_5262/g.8076 Transcript_5262/m.8076 type:complete len:394 (+) Transcript_5262:290-1471(+)
MGNSNSMKNKVSRRARKDFDANQRGANGQQQAAGGQQQGDNWEGEKKPLQMTRTLSLRADGDTLTTLLPQYYDVDWSKRGELGRGHYAVVFRGQNRATGQQVAIKRIRRSLTRPATLKTEIRALRKVKGHPNIVQLFDVYYNQEYVVLVLELLAGGELFDRIVSNGAYSERDASQHIKKIGHALQYMHSQGIVHRDLKPENLVLVDDRVTSDIKISDFGLSKILNDDQTTMQTVCGTRAYSAPEVNFGGPARSGRYTEKVDTWSLGVILYVILAAYHPFDPYGDSTDADIWARICRGEWDFNDEVWDSISDEAKDLIHHLLCRNPSKRYGTQELLNHRWITQYNEMPATPLKSLTSSAGGRSLRNILSMGQGQTGDGMEVDEQTHKAEDFANV